MSVVSCSLSLLHLLGLLVQLIYNPSENRFRAEARLAPHDPLTRFHAYLSRALVLAAIALTMWFPLPAGAAPVGLVIDLTAGDDTVTISGNATQTTIDIGGVVSVHPHPIDSIAVNAGDGNDTINIAGLIGPYPVNLYVYGDAGNDTINIVSASPINTSEELSLSSDLINIDAGSITTIGPQTYDGPVVILDATSINAAAASDIIFTDTVDGSFNLIVNADFGDVDFRGAIGSTTPLDSFTAIGASINLWDNISTLGDQLYQGPVVLNADIAITVLQFDIIFLETIDGPFNLMLGSGGPGNVELYGAVGGAFALQTITVNAPLTEIHADITTLGLQLYNTPVEFYDFHVLRTGPIVFIGPVDLNDELVILATGDVVFVSDVLAQVPSAPLVVDSDADVFFAGIVETSPAVAIWAVDITFDGPVQGLGELILGAAGTAEFSAGVTSSYAGETTLDFGTALVNGTLDSSGGLITAEPSALLGGTGIINRSVTIDAASATLNINAAGLMSWEIWQGASFVIISNDGADAVVGTFSGSPEGALVAADLGGTGFDLRISYAAGDGNDVALIAERPQLPDTGFSPGRITPLTTVLEASHYSSTAIQLAIPSLDVRADIVSVPQFGSGWDVRWLWHDVGYLEGSAFPTLAGNTVLSAHNVTPDGLPGPFIDLHSLRWDDVIQIHAWGRVYTYAVRGNYLVRPDDVRPLEHKDHDWVTLVTCQGYDWEAESYAFRRVVQAVLVSVR
jgi:LPXTG-site transpeptidase (sortase) family protein